MDQAPFSKGVDSNMKENKPAPLSTTTKRFHLEINSFGEFIQFVAIIRGEELDLEKLKQLNAEVNTDVDVLIKAMDSQNKK